jgi:hypothetical protein
MNNNIVFSSQRQVAIEAFHRYRFKAAAVFTIAKLFSKKVCLPDFSQVMAVLNPGAEQRGVQDIPVDQITGSASRTCDYDRFFRPLKNHLRERWVSAYLSLMNSSWKPIKVYKVDSEYYVADGHHRVSVARYAGVAYIAAEVFEYSLKSQAESKPARRSRPRLPAPLKPDVRFSIERAAYHQANEFTRRTPRQQTRHISKFVNTRSKAHGNGANIKTIR